MSSETILSVFPGESANHRLVVALENPSDEPSRLVLRQESRAERVGWFVQSRVSVSPDQVSGLRMALGRASNELPAQSSEGTPVQPRQILSFTEAVSRVG